MNYPAVHRWLVEHTSLEPALLEGAGFETVIAERLAESATDEADYVATLGRSVDEVNRLTAHIAVPETWLFRYPQSYQLLVEFLHRRRTSGGGRILQMCSIGCATGQEPYCMAMAALHAGWAASQISVIGVDRNPEFLRVAAAAEFGPASIRGEIPTWAMQYLARHGDRVSIESVVRSVVRFVQADVTEPAGLCVVGRCDVVFCRNLLIYLNARARERLLNSICDALAPDGLLFVGHAEQVIRGSTPLRAVAAPHAFALERSPTATAETERRLPARRSTKPLVTLVQPAVLANHSPARAVPPTAVSTPDLTLEDAKELADAGRVSDGESIIRTILARHGPSAAAIELLGTIRMAANDVSEAKRLFEQAVYLDPTRSTSLMQLAIISERDGNPSRAALLWERARRATTISDKEVKP